MQCLETELKIQNRRLKQIERSGMVALYELYGAQGSLYGFELIIIKIYPAQEIFGKLYAEREAYPSNEDWGTWAWSYGALQREKALSAYQSLCRLQHAPAIDVNDLPLREGK